MTSRTRFHLALSTQLAGNLAAADLARMVLWIKVRGIDPLTMNHLGVLLWETISCIAHTPRCGPAVGKANPPVSAIGYMAEYLNKGVGGRGLSLPKAQVFACHVTHLHLAVRSALRTEQLHSIPSNYAGGSAGSLKRRLLWCDHPPASRRSRVAGHHGRRSV